jgi:hypothetical protein
LRSNSSVVKSVRLTTELNYYLGEESRRSGTTVSSLVSQILSNHRDRYSYLDKPHSVSMLSSTLTSILTLVDENELVKIAPSIASGLLVFNTHVLGGQKTLEGLEWCITQLMPTLNWYNCFHTNDVYMIDHGMGGKWTSFLSSFLTTLIELETGTKPKISREGEILIMDSVIKDRKNRKNEFPLNGKNGSVRLNHLNI